ncbi:DUF2247 family protein [Fictibacillus sp. NRS-1165]|uniref:DUF2247 family protein n=1 Tax=Fictibacillus sp. NRS-1165 TaxID=3144463 RepID=UPI003D24B1BB
MLKNLAVKQMDNALEASNQNIIQLAWGGDDLEIWHLAYLHKRHSNNPERLLAKVAEVYANFNYSKDMDSFIHYLPPDDLIPSSYSKEENVSRLINRFNDFLNVKCKYLKGSYDYVAADSLLLISNVCRKVN